jgi:hypothetical protein
MNFSSNQVIVGTSYVQDGFISRIAISAGLSLYDNIVNEDLTNSCIMHQILSKELQTYLNQYFPNWRLLRQVDEHQRSNIRPKWKNVYYVITVETDADAETLRSHLQKIDYVKHYEHIM